MSPSSARSSLRFGKATQAARNGKIGKIVRCETTSPCTLEKTHPDLYWYGIHGVESLFTVMGTGCKSVRRTVSTPAEDVVVGTWDGGRPARSAARGRNGGYGGKAEGTAGTLVVGQYEGYRPLVVAIVEILQNGCPARESGRNARSLRLHVGGRRKQTPTRRPRSHSKASSRRHERKPRRKSDNKLEG